MATYHNAYTQEEDQVLWEIHEIRHTLHSEIEKKSISTINSDAKEILKKWKTMVSDQERKSAS